MTFKDQLTKLKDNWLIVLILVVVLGFFFFSGGSSSIPNISSGEFLESASESFMARDEGMASSQKMAYAPSIAPYPSGNFAPEVTERKITKSSSLTTEVERGEFEASEKKLKDIVKASDAYLLNENVHKYESGRREYYQGAYTLKVDTKKYDSVRGVSVSG